MQFDISIRKSTSCLTIPPSLPTKRKVIVHFPLRNFMILFQGNITSRSSDVKKTLFLPKTSFKRVYNDNNYFYAEIKIINTLKENPF